MQRTVGLSIPVAALLGTMSLTLKQSHHSPSSNGSSVISGSHSNSTVAGHGQNVVVSGSHDRIRVQGTVGRIIVSGSHDTITWEQSDAPTVIDTGSHNTVSHE